MPSSYRLIDYRIRPAKHAERLMMCDALRRIRFATIESYQYVGLGSVYFSDFGLFHKALGIGKMISIECEKHDKIRFESNLPYASIEMLWGPTSSELAKVDLGLRTVAWLDYDDPLNPSILNDITAFTTRACSGSVLIISTQCMPPKFDGANPRKNASELTMRLGRERVGSDVDDEQLMGWGSAQIFRDIIVNEIETALATRNGVLPLGQRMAFEQIFNFHYADGAHMLTVGGVLFDHGQRALFDASSFRNLDFVRTGKDPFKIGIPKLTLRELRTLESQMPLQPGQEPSYEAMPKRDVDEFVRIYRYFPNFAAIDL